MTILDDRTNLLAWDFGPKPRAARRRTAAISLALERCDFDFDRYLLPRMQAWNVPFIGLRFTGTTNFWDGEDYEINLSDRYGTRWFRDRSGEATASMYLHEVGHVVDTFILTQDNENRRAITAAFCPTGVHQWLWGGNYQNRTGEAFADAFVALYGGGLRPWQDRTWGHHKLTPKVEAVIRGILEN